MEVSAATIVAASKTAKIPRKEPTYLSLPTEIITDIFSRLPAKFVFQMECLSKHYSSSLSKDPYFVEAHFRQSSRLRPSLIVQKPYGFVSLIRSNGDKITEEKVTLPPNIRNFEIVASCNGLVLAVDGGRCSVWNPATMTFLDLPCRSLFSMTVSWGFGYCNQSHDYKIVNISMSIRKHSKKEFSAEVICINKNRVWRSVDFSGFEICNSKSAMILNGVAYWKPTWLKPCKYSILTFDLAKEKFAWIPCPLLGEIMVFKGSLTIGVCDTFRSTCTLWVLKDEPVVNMDSWMVQCCFDFITSMMQPIGFFNDHQLLLQDLLFPLETDEDLEQEDQPRCECFLYDVDTKEIKLIPDLFANYWEEAYYNFTESLVTLMA